MKKYILLFLCLIQLSGSFAQMQDFKFKFYGQIRTDFYYNSRANEETVDGLFYMYPKDKVRDPEGNDLNSTPNSNFYTFIFAPWSRRCRSKTGNSQDICQSRSRLPRHRHFLFGHSPSSCLFESGLGKINFITRTELASLIRRCVSADS